MRYLPAILLFLSLQALSQTSDTLNGFQQKIKGEEINYFSPLHQFAKTALLTRVNGEMPISWQSPVYAGNLPMVTYQFLMGHSTGTSTGDRHFDVTLNDLMLFTITTPMKQKGSYTIEGRGENNSSFFFIHDEYDVNGDGFGKLFITIPANLAKGKANFTINGINENSRDWLMIFMYQKGLKIIAEPTNLVTRKENKRQLNIFIDNPYPANTALVIKTKSENFQALLQTGYNKLSFPAYPPDLTGSDTIQFILADKDPVVTGINLSPIRNYLFNIIHHSHNDIGYSHLQSEVEQIQNRNIRDAIRLISSNTSSTQKPIWHIESLWAVENFLRTASSTEEQQFVKAVKKGHLILSANYANILTGLCQPEELNWMVEYARELEKKYDFRISNAMITDIPGISRSALLSYVNNNIPFLSLGPNYVESLPDKGDRVGAVMKDQGDKIFYWKPSLSSNKKLLVWIAGRGYSMFHGITDGEKQKSWEKRISEYCNELSEKNYAYDLVQLRYTKNADNGPVDSLLTGFVENWNEQYITPQLKIASVDQLFQEFEKKYGNSIPFFTGEISPYWEDGAYSTAIEEMENRELVIKTIALEKKAKAEGKFKANSKSFYLLHKNILLFHEHTWGAWCSISDPEISFTTEQWKIKKQFLDSAKYYYKELAAGLNFQYQPPAKNYKFNQPITDFTVDSLHGGLLSVLSGGKNMVSQKEAYHFFEPVYVSGINPSVINRSQQIKIIVKENSPFKKIIEVQGILPSIPAYTVVYTLHKKENRLTCHYRFEKLIEKNKESLHIAFPFNFENPVIDYGSENNRLRFNTSQLAGSNKDFICVEKDIRVKSANVIARLTSPSLCLYEVGSIIDENKINGCKVWKRVNNITSTLFLYVFNNYWHTNYKAYQGGYFDFEIELSFPRMQ
jgi:alpha-mannosidase